MAKRRITKASKRRLTIFGTISLVAIIYFCFSLIYNIYSINVLSAEKKELEKLYIKLQEESEELKLDIDKLNDPEYLADYARENYLYSKDNEYILQIEEIVEKEEEIYSITTNINKNYILLGLVFSIFLIFLYIFMRSKKKTKKK